MLLMGNRLALIRSSKGRAIMEESMNIEQERQELEKKRLAVKEKLKKAELRLRLKELEANSTDVSPTRIPKISAISPSTIAAFIAIIATLFGYLIQSSLNRGLEREKVQGQLILKAIETGDTEKARVNLRFFVETGLLSDPDGKLKAALDRIEKNPASAPVLPTTNIKSYPVTIINIADNGYVHVGDSLAYTLNYSLSGNVTFPDVIVSDILPDEVSLVSATGDYELSGRTLIWYLGTLTPNVSGSIKIIVRINSKPLVGSGISNTARIDAGDKHDFATAYVGVAD